MEEINIVKFKVLSSGSFIALTKERSEILVKRGNEKATIEIIFKEKEEKKVYTSSRGSGNNITVSFEFPLVKNAIGEGLVDPIKFLIFDNGDFLYLHLWARKLTDFYLEIVYSVYLEEI